MSVLIDSAKPKVIIVSNRLPVTVEEKEGVLEYVASAGGVATGLSSLRDSAVWVGWPGQVPQRHHRQVEEHLRSAHGCAPVFLSDRVVEKYYEGFSNRTLWPLFHSFQSLAKYSAAEWSAYVEANQKFLQVLDGIIKPGDKVWIHDYQLLLLSGLLRQRYPGLSIGFFLHIPFPSYDVLRQLPQHREILQSLLCADVVGFHTNDYTSAFLDSVSRAIGIQDRLGQLLVGERVVHTIVHPMGICFDKFNEASASFDGQPLDLDLRSLGQDMKLVFSLSRLDYTKGILQSLASYELLLERHPEMHTQVALVLCVVPSRERVEKYASLKREIDEAVGRINSRFAKISWTPIRYIYRSLSFEELVVLYRNVHVAMITPLRDGMNLVAKEFVASRTDESGALILSEMAGAAKELLDAVIVNPNSREEITGALEKALSMSAQEQQARMRSMRTRLAKAPIQDWGADFLRKLDQCTIESAKAKRASLTEEVVKTISGLASSSRRRLFVLDYDGTLMPLMNDPKSVSPDRDLLSLLTEIGACETDDVLVLSGRRKADLERWLNGTNVCLVAEHGAWVKEPSAKSWRNTGDSAPSDWKAEIKEALKIFVEKIPGSWIEEKDYSLVWHYRNAEKDSAESAAKDLAFYLLGLVGDSPVRILPGSRSIEVRSIGIGKGRFLANEIDFSKYDFVFAAGDDLTDEDMFRSLPKTAVSIKVGYGFSRARYKVKSYKELRSLLHQMSRKPQPLATANS